MGSSKRYYIWPLRRIGASRFMVKLLCLISFSLSTVIFMSCLLDGSVQKTNHQECPSDVNRKSKVLSERNIHVLPSNLPVSEGVEVAGNQGAMTQEIECLNLALPDYSREYKMCIYNPNYDQVVSNHIKKYGAWEKENVREMLKALKASPDLMLVDLGSNIGTFALPAALTGTEVIAVDALKDNHQLLQKSLAENNLQCRVTLVHNALYNQQSLMKIILNPLNIGGSAVTSLADSTSSEIQAREKVDAICLDDLIPLVKGKNVFLKMDLEDSEDAVLECAHQFFKEVKVKVLLIEWINYRHDERRASNIKRFLASHNMVATWGVDRIYEIDPSASHSWPDNVFWMEK